MVDVFIVAFAFAIAGPPSPRKNSASVAISRTSNRKRLEGELSCGVGVLYSSTDTSSPVVSVQMDWVKGGGFGEVYSSTLVHHFCSSPAQICTRFAHPDTS